MRIILNQNIPFFITSLKIDTIRYYRRVFYYKSIFNSLKRFGAKIFPSSGNTNWKRGRGKIGPSLFLCKNLMSACMPMKRLSHFPKSIDDIQNDLNLNHLKLQDWLHANHRNTRTRMRGLFFSLSLDSRPMMR